MYKVVSKVNRFQCQPVVQERHFTTPGDAWAHVCELVRTHRDARRENGNDAGTQGITITYNDSLVSKKELEKRATVLVAPNPTIH